MEPKFWEEGIRKKKQDLKTGCKKTQRSNKQRNSKKKFGVGEDWYTF